MRHEGVWDVREIGASYVSVLPKRWFFHPAGAGFKK